MKADRSGLRLPPVCWVLGLAALVAMLIYFGLLHWWLVAPAWKDAREMRQLRAQQATQAGLLAQRPTWQARLAGNGNAAAERRDALPDGEPSAAAADLMQRVVSSVSRHANAGPCEVLQKMPVPADEGNASAFVKVRITLSLHCAMRPLAAVITDIEYGHPLMFVDDFMMYAAHNDTGAVDDGEAEVQMTVAGFVRDSSTVSSDRTATGRDASRP